MSDAVEMHFHGNQQRFRDGLAHTASATGFSERLIEKDYYCSLLLRDFEALFAEGLVFKGGTCLSKVHVEFFRLSEDLDFGISVKPDASRGDRRDAIEPAKQHLPGITTRLPCFIEKVKLTGHNNNRQYNAEYAFRSEITGDMEAIKVEISLREEVLLPAAALPAKTMLIDPMKGTSAVASFTVNAISLAEAYAEKTRAALTRREPAIRDFFDIHAAVQKGLVDHGTPEFLELVAKKLAATTDQVDLSDIRVEALRRQIETQLKPVLRMADYEGFALDKVIELLSAVTASYKTD
jgi:predicted nucleotidyltransferase component of viral defense system